MVSPVSVVVVEIVIQNIEEQALTTYQHTLPLWLRCDDIIRAAVHKDRIEEFNENLNKQNADIQFTNGIEENGKIPFIDCLVTGNKNCLRTTVYRENQHAYKPNQSHNQTTSKAATAIRTLTRRAQIFCDSNDSSPNF